MEDFLGLFHPLSLSLHVFCDGTSNQFRHLDFGAAFPRKSTRPKVVSNSSEHRVVFGYFNEMFHCLLPKRYFSEDFPKNPSKLPKFALSLWLSGHSPNFHLLLSDSLPWVPRDHVKFLQSSNNNKAFPVFDLLQILRIREGPRHLRRRPAAGWTVRGPF